MFKTKPERIAYVKDQKNWEVVSEGTKIPTRILKLKKTNIIKIQLKMYVSDFIGEHWTTVGTYELDGKNRLKDLYDLEDTYLYDYIGRL